ncbi:MAG: SAM-dependent methyltransferase [Bacteroidales bacterium]
MNTKTSTGSIFLIPSHLGEPNYSVIFPPHNAHIISSLSFFIAENIRTARRGIKALLPDTSIDSLSFSEFNKHTQEKDISGILAPVFNGQNIGVLSEAGMPCIADPGNKLVAYAHKHNIQIIPLIGPNSILLALTASGFNGQQFTFHGYIPIKQGRKKAIQKMEQDAQHTSYTQIFMETPYRNQKLFEELVHTLKPHTKLCIACDITLSSEYICTQSITKWKQQPPNLHKRPCIFLIQ